MFKHLRLTRWRQFFNIEIDFHDRLTILTGTNGSGKTTILNLLANRFGLELPYVRVPRVYDRENRWGSDKHHGHETTAVGTLEIQSDGSSTNTCVLTDNSIGRRTYSLSADPKQVVNGLHIPSHRPPVIPREISTVEVSGVSVKETMTMYRSRTESYLTGGWDRKPDDLFWQDSEERYYPSTIIKNWIATKAYSSQILHISSNNLREKTTHDGDLEDLESFVIALSILFPKAFGFEGIRVAGPDVLLTTANGDVNFDSLSGGLHAILDISFQIFLASLEWSFFAVTFDEPENHLHPSMQAEILPRLVEAFPRAQFIVATHSPVVINSVENSSVYALSKEVHTTGIVSKLLESFEKAGTADDMLRDVLGVPSAMPTWAATRLEAILRKYESLQISSEMLEEFRNELQQANLSKYAPQGELSLIDSLDD